MTTNHITMNGYRFESILKLQITKEIWEHPTAHLEGHIHESDTASILERISSGQHLLIRAVDDTGSETTLFNGLIENIGTKTCNNLSTLIVSGIGYSALLDVNLQIRTFQDSSMTYKQVFEYLKEDMPSDYILPEVGIKSINEMLVQYDETNWEFAKRIASRIGTVVVADSMLGSPFLSIGIPNSKTTGNIDSEEYEIVRDVNQFLRLKKNGKRNIKESSTMYISVKSRTFYELCDKVTFEDKDLLVYKLDISLIGSELIGTYILKNKESLVSTEYCNEKIIGASLSGVVKEVKEDMVRVDLFDDIEQIKNKWFVYSTPYSSPDGTGWYFMPEIGDEVRLHFPAETEHEGYVISSTHITHGDRSDPEIKFIRTCRNQSITFHPDAIHIDDGQGSEILLEKDTGIKINTNKKINMSAQENISISSQGKVTIQGDDSVKIKQNDSLIHVDDTIDISASHVRVQ